MAKTNQNKNSKKLNHKPFKKNFRSDKFNGGNIIKVIEKAKPLRWNNRAPNASEVPNIPIDKEAIARHSRGFGMNVKKGVKTRFFKEKFQKKENDIRYATEQAAKAEILLNENDGFLQCDEGEHSVEFSQKEIIENVDITAATKYFNLHLDFGPYRMRYTKNGRHLLIGGRMGHVAAFDWITKKLHCEMNVTEEVCDVTWLHIETMFAVAQKNWVHFYDNCGTEIHCVKRMNEINRLEFLPYHFLLASGGGGGFLTWLDVSIGELVANYNTHLESIRLMCQNPANGVICVGGSKGVVSMWSPNSNKALATILCHRTPMSALAVDPYGYYLATSAVDKSVKIWDLRELSKPLFQYRLGIPANEIKMSQKGLLALAMGNVCEIYHKPNSSISPSQQTYPYLRQKCSNYIHGMDFCPYEDVLGISTSRGFTSILVPGSGEPNFDAYEANPFQTKSQRKENEVHKLLEKIPMEFITLDANKIGEVDIPTLKERIETKTKLFFSKPPVINFEPRKKMKGKGGSANASKSRKIVKETAKREFVKEMRNVKKQIFKEHISEDFIPLEQSKPIKKSVLDRFKNKKHVK